MSSNLTVTSSNNSEIKVKKVKSEKEEEVIELPKTLDYLFEKELINRQNKHIYIMDTFGPSKNTHYLLPKFYAEHEQFIPENYKQYMPFVDGTSYKHNTEANVYGWMPDTVNRRDILKQLNFIYAPKQRCYLTQYGEKVNSDRANDRPPFNGLRFFL